MPADLAQTHLVLDYNDAEGLRDAFSKHGKTIACVIVEPGGRQHEPDRAQAGIPAAMRELI